MEKQNEARSMQSNLLTSSEKLHLRPERELKYVHFNHLTCLGSFLLFLETIKLSKVSFTSSFAV